MATYDYSIIILEDSLEDRLLYCHYLTQSSDNKYKLTKVKTGREVLEQLRKTKPDLILLPDKVPDIDIWELLNQLVTWKIPIILLAESDNTTVAVEAMKLGVKDYLIKNKITSNQLFFAVNNVLEKQQLLKKIHQQEEQQKLLADISLRISQRWNLDTILQTAVEAVRKFLQTDRVLVYQFDQQMNGTVLAESVLPEWKSLLNRNFQDNYDQQNHPIRDKYNNIVPFTEIYHLAECQVKANLVVPILLNQNPRDEEIKEKQNSNYLWGLLIAHQCSVSRDWQTIEINLIQQVSVQIAIAIQQTGIDKKLEKVRDITEQTKSEIALRNSEEKFRKFAENSREVILLREVESGKLLYVNPAYTEIWGESTESLYENPNSWIHSIHPDDLPLIQKQHQETEKHIFLNIEYRIIRPDDSIRWIWGRCFPIYDSKGEIYRIAAIAQDITNRKQAEQERDRLLQKLELQNQNLEYQISQRTAELQQSEKRFRNLVETSSDWIWEVNECGVYTYASPQIEKILGYSPAEIIGKTPFDLMPSEEAARVLAKFTKYVREKSGFQCLENINLHKDGRLITLETSGVPIFDAEQKLCGYRGIDRDITVRKQTEKQLRQNEARFQRIVKNAPGVMYQYLLHPDQSHEFIYISDRCQEMYELEAEIILKNTNYLFSLTHPEDVSTLLESIAYSAESLQQWSWQGRIITPSGKMKWIQGISQPEKQANGDILWDGLIIDITERKQIEIAYRHLSDRLDLAITSAQIGIWDWDIINDHLIWDRRMYQIYGFPPSHVWESYQKWETALHPEDVEHCQIAIQQAIEGTKNFDTEFRIIHPDGKVRFIKGYALIKRDDQSKATRMIGINLDISDHKQEELKNKRLKERLEFLLSASPAVIYTCPASHKFQPTFISKNVNNVIGYNKEKWLGEQNFWLNHIHPEDLNQLLTQLSHLEEQEYHLYKYRLRDQNGNYYWIEDKFRLLRDKNGKAIEIIGYLVDITEKQAVLQEREQVQAEIIRSRDLREAIFNESADALFLVDIETVRTTDCNKRAVEMFNANSKHDLIGIEGHKLQLKEFTPEEIQTIMDEMKIHGIWSREIEYKTFQGDIFWGNLAAKEITVGGEKINLVRVTDINQRKLAETQLQEKNKQLAAFNEELTRATRLKDDFLANMSHELRTPLNAILGLSESLQESTFGLINDKQHQSLKIIERSGQHLLELINDILDLSKIESGHISLNYIPTNINHLCQSSVTFIKQQAFQKRIDIELKIQPNLPNIVVDERRIRQVLINLLNNAVKFTPEDGKITLEATLQIIASTIELPSYTHYISIKVIDTGIGIAPENIYKLFQPFVQIDSSLNRQYNGTGLGLALVKRLVELHGGKVDVISELGVGSCFSIALPCSVDLEYSLTSIPQFSSDLELTNSITEQKQPLILLAEDNEANTFTICNYLSATGYQIVKAKNGREAVEMAKSQLPDVIVMDIQMPEVDGLQAIKQIREDENLVNIPIIALTALAMPGDKEECLAAGANDYLQKPVKLKELKMNIKKWIVDS